MNATDSYTEWDAAYVLGALSPADRREYELHLSECDSCSAAVADLVALPGLLATLSTETVQSLPGPAQTGDAFDPAAANLLPGLVRRINRRRHRIRTAYLGIASGSIAASVAITMALILPAGSGQRQQPDVAHGSSESSQASAVHELEFIPVTPSSLTATGTLADRPWGTLIEWECRYAGATYAGSGPQDYSLVVTDRTGQTQQVASWVAGAGSSVAPAATTSIALSDIRLVEIRVGETGPALLTATP